MKPAASTNMKNKTQKDRVVSKLLKDGFITRNECLRNFISRLGAIICDLEREGWEFEAKYTKDRDYLYKVLKCPLKKVIYTVGDKQIVTYTK